jgi:eukaryotic-like serine/threonine-protein kinase
MGVVYRAHDERLDRDVALKVLPAGSLGDEDARRRFRKEALALSKLNHPHIATIHDFDSQGGIDFLVMELISGKAISHVIREGGLSDSEVRDLSLQLADGLVTLHRHGIVHRDLKPGNLRLTADGRLKILDFGLARLLQPVTSEPTVTSTGTPEFAGTLAYMAPEQVRGEAIDARTDVYAAGAVMYELATGRPLFPGARGAELVGAILSQAPAKPKAINPQLSDSLEHVILSALSKDRTTRLSSSADLQKALTQVGPPQQAGHGARRTAQIAAVAAAIAVLAGALWYLPQLRSKQVQPAAKITVAVLPFHALGVSQPTRFLGVGIPDAIITRLAGLQQLIPRPTSAVLKYENASIDPKDAGKALGCDYVLTGILQEANERLRVSVQLVRAQDGAPMWGEHYDLARSDLLMLQDQIAQAVADALKIQMTAAERERLFHRYTENVAAYERYLRGRAQFARYSPESLQEAVHTFEEALKLDKDYAPAHAGVALASALMGLRFAPASESRGWNERAEREAQAALQIDPQLAEAHEALAAVYRAVEFEWERALDESRLALALNPHLDQPRLYRAAAFYHLGLLDLVEPELQAAAATLNPDPANQVETLRTRGITALLAGRYQDALLLFEDVQRLSGGTAFNYLRGLAHYYTGDASRAEEILALRGSTRGDRRSQAVLASLLARRRADSEARALIREIQQGGYTDHHIAYSLGAAYAQLGEFPEAVRWLADAARTGLPCYPWYARDPLLDPLRKDPTFQKILEGLQSSWQTLFARYKSAPT